MMFYHLQCVGCGAKVAEKDSVARCPACGEALDVIFEAEQLAARVAADFDAAAPLTGLKYRAHYPLTSAHPISLAEGGTPLLQLKKLGAELGQPHLFVKNEGQNPTGVFKDRGSLVEITKALELKAEAIVCASTGNMAASVAAYSAAAGLPCYVLIPEGTPLGKLSQSLGYGARVLQIRGTYGDCCRLAEEMAARHGFYLAGDYAFRGEGQKTLAFEVVEQLGRVPDVVVVPVGCGTNIAAIWKGFTELKQLGKIETLPRMVGVQPAGCSTVCAAFSNNLAKAPLVAQPATICSAVGIGTPLDDVKALAALRDSHGTAVTLDEAEVQAAQVALGGREAIFTEPSGALPFAAVPHLQKSGFLKPNETVVLVATGVGLKDPKNALAAHPNPPAVEPDMREVDNYLKHKLYAIRAAGFQGAEEVLFAALPTSDVLQSVVIKEFSAELDNEQLARLSKIIAIFLAKGKAVQKSDLQHLVEDILTDLPESERRFRVRDYSLHVGQKLPPEAGVTIELNGEERQAMARGVGPVDAVVNAIRRALATADTTGFRLTDFDVGIADRGTEATTEVRMTLASAAGHTVTATATSPDIISASIAAFEKGYNILLYKQRGNNSMSK